MLKPTVTNSDGTERERQTRSSEGKTTGPSSGQCIFGRLKIERTTDDRQNDPKQSTILRSNR